MFAMINCRQNYINMRCLSTGIVLHTRIDNWNEKAGLESFFPPQWVSFKGCSSYNKLKWEIGEFKVRVIHHYLYLSTVTVMLLCAGLSLSLSLHSIPCLTFHLSSISGLSPFPFFLHFNPSLCFSVCLFPLLPFSRSVSLSVSFCLQTLSSGYCFLCKTLLFEWSFI